MLSPIACKWSPFPIVTYPYRPIYHLPRLNSPLILFRSWYARSTSIIQWIVYLFSSRRFTFVCKPGVREITSSAKVGKVRWASAEISKLFKFQESIREFEHGWHRVTSDKLGRSRTRSVQPSRVDRNRLLPNWYEVEFTGSRANSSLLLILDDLSVAVTGTQTPSAYWNCSLVAIMLKIFFEILRNNWDKRCKKSSLRIIYSRCQISFSILSLLLSALCLIFAPDRSSSRNVAVIRET